MTKQLVLNADQLQEFFKTGPCKEALADFCFRKRLLPKKRGLTVGNVLLPVKTAVIVSMDTTVDQQDMDIILQRNADILIEVNALTDPEGIRRLSKELRTPTETIDFSVHTTKRIHTTMNAARISTLFELVQYTPEEIFKFRNFGTICIAALMNMLHDKGLALGMNVDKFRPTEA